jgi:hypothetical protein
VGGIGEAEGRRLAATVGVETASAVGVGGSGVPAMAVGTAPTGWITLRTYVFATSNRQASRALMLGISETDIARITRIPAIPNIRFLFCIRKSVPEPDETVLTYLDMSLRGSRSTPKARCSSRRLRSVPVASKLPTN